METHYNLHEKGNNQIEFSLWAKHYITINNKKQLFTYRHTIGINPNTEKINLNLNNTLTLFNQRAEKYFNTIQTLANQLT